MHWPNHLAEDTRRTRVLGARWHRLEPPRQRPAHPQFALLLLGFEWFPTTHNILPVCARDNAALSFTLPLFNGIPQLFLSKGTYLCCFMVSRFLSALALMDLARSPAPHHGVRVRVRVRVRVDGPGTVACPPSCPPSCPHHAPHHAPIMHPIMHPSLYQFEQHLLYFTYLYG